MAAKPSVIISAFADEAANHRTALEQMTALAAIGIRNYSPRFIDVLGDGKIEHVVDLSPEKLQRLKEYHAEYGVSVTSIGARVGKVKLKDVDDGSHNKFVPIAEYLSGEVARTIAAAKTLDTKLIRGFSFYHPRGTRPEDSLDAASDQIRQIAQRCADEGLVYGLEIEPNLVGETGPLLAELAKRVDHPNMVLIFDGGNVAAQNKNPVQVFEEYRATVPYLGWMHVKDYRIDPSLVWTGAVDEERLKNFVPANAGDAGHELIFRDLREELPGIQERLNKLGIPGFYLETEPHLKGGGQFGGFSGPDGMGVAVRALCSCLDYAGIGYTLRSFADIRQLRGF
ncbi:MAG: sugar phosphate isomerase/epimerase [Planctomycetaceae bacterium]|nr:sugar phosphate isomerase/epimerase [Planctomycetaceae bacterium]